MTGLRYFMVKLSSSEAKQLDVIIEQKYAIFISHKNKQKMKTWKNIHKICCEYLH